MGINLDGLLLVDKPVGLTSFDVLRRLKSAGIRDVGHGGTLDPFATGLLAVFSGQALRLSEYFLKSSKTYEAKIEFGRTTTSGDFTDPVTETSSVRPGSLDQLNALAAEWMSRSYEQIPPMHSAKKQGGKKLYELAREGVTVERKPVTCKLSGFQFLEYDSAKGLARFTVTVSSGTYIRVLAQDFAKALGTVGGLQELRRTASGSFALSETAKLEELVVTARNNQLKNQNDPLPGFMSLIDCARKAFHCAEVNAVARDAAWHGHQDKLFRVIASKLEDVPASYERVALIHEGHLVGIIERHPTHAWAIGKTFLQN